MLYCLAGALLAGLVRTARRRTDQNEPLLLALLFGSAGGVFAFEALVTGLVLLRLVSAPGPLALRLGLLLGSGTLTLVAAGAGAAAALSNIRRKVYLGLAAAGGAFAAEVVDLHTLKLHVAHGVIAEGLAHLLPVWLMWMGFPHHLDQPGESCESETGREQDGRRSEGVTPPAGPRRYGL